MQNFRFIGGPLDNELMALSSNLGMHFRVDVKQGDSISQQLYRLYPEFGVAIIDRFSAERVEVHFEVTNYETVTAPDGLIENEVGRLLMGRIAQLGAHEDSLVRGVTHNLERDSMTLSIAGLVIKVKP